MNDVQKCQPIEKTIHADLPIIDAHHHLWAQPGSQYLLDEFIGDTSSGHNIIGSVYVQCRSMYRSSGPEQMRVVGETEFADEIAAQSKSGLYGPTRVCAGIVGYADLSSGHRAEPILQEHINIASDRFRGVRHITAWDSDQTLHAPNYLVAPQMLAQPDFREGLDCLRRLDLSFDALVFHPQLQDLIGAARALPDLRIVLNHIGLPLRIGQYAGMEDAVFNDWKSSMTELAKCRNVTVKLGGLNMHWLGLPFRAAEQASSQTLADTWRPFIETCIEAFGPDRCMFESNFPPDSRGTDYHTLWNAFKKIASGASDAEKDHLFRRTAVTTYKLQLPETSARPG